MKKILFSLAICAMMMGLVSCEPIGNDNSPFIGHWTIQGIENFTIDFDQDKAIVKTYDEAGEAYRTNYFEYIISRKKLYFAVYNANMELYAHECEYRFDGDDSVIIKGLKPIIYYGTDISFNADSEVIRLIWPYGDKVTTHTPAVHITSYTTAHICNFLSLLSQS